MPKLSKAQRIGIANAIVWYLEGSKSFKRQIPETVDLRMRRASKNFMDGIQTDQDIEIARYVDRLPYTREEDLRKRAAQENAFRRIGPHIYTLPATVTEREEMLFDYIFDIAKKGL